MHLAGGKQYGFIAQDVQLLIPALVTDTYHPPVTDTLGNVVTPGVNFKAMNYIGIIPFLTKAIQDQQRIIDSLTVKTGKQDSINNSVQSQIAALQSAISSCCSSSQQRAASPTTLAQRDVTLSDKDVIVLNQNVPNPFAEQTTITFSVPEKVGVAQILFYNNLGQVIKVIDIKTRGRGQLNVFANDLTSGMYSYTLFADGKAIATKKMVKED